MWRKTIGRPKSETCFLSSPFFFAPNLRFPHSCIFQIDFHLLLRVENVHSEVSFPLLSSKNTSMIQMKINIAISVSTTDGSFWKCVKFLRENNDDKKCKILAASKLNLHFRRRSVQVLGKCKKITTRQKSQWRRKDKDFMFSLSSNFGKKFWIFANQGFWLYKSLCKQLTFLKPEYLSNITLYCFLNIDWMPSGWNILYWCRVYIYISGIDSQTN